jgi:hypothetical protein
MQLKKKLVNEYWLNPVRKGPEEYPAGFDGAGLTAISGVFNDIFSSDCHTDTNTT